MKRGARWLSAGFGALALALASCGADRGAEPLAGAAGAAGAAGRLGLAAMGGQPAAAGAGGASGGAGTDGSGDAGLAGAAGSAATAGSAGSAATAGSGGQGDEGCDAASVGDLAIYLRSTFDWDPLGYPPYAFDGCTLVYVAAGSDPGALHVRNLATTEDELLEPASSKPRRPTVAGPVIAWEADGALGSEVRVRYDGKVETMSGAFVRAEEPRATNDALVFTAFMGAGAHDDSDVYLFDVVSSQLSLVAGGAGQQRFADVSATHVAITDFSEDPKGYFDETGSISDIALIERASGARTDRAAPGKQAFPLLSNDGVFAYLEWAAVHPEPKFGQFWLKVGYLDRPISDDFNVKTTGQVSTNPAYVRPSLRGLNLDFVDQDQSGAPSLYRAALATPGTLVASKIAGALQLFGPVAGDRFTLLANQRSAQNFALVAVPR
ncbi:MAG TPA: hypothetical protein VGJ91_08920 [Polyangiaceae bacterium]|jgi:hypothetical protein